MPRPSTPAEERFWSRVNKCESGCWEWTAALNETGYGVVSYKGGMRRVHRLVYTLCIAPIPAGLYVLHNCDNMGCCNPAHMRLGTQQDNMADRWTRTGFRRNAA